MSQLIFFDNVQYAYPTNGEVDWGTVVTQFAAALGAQAATLSSVQTLTNKTIRAAAGLAAAPGVAFVGNTNSGLFSPGAGSLGISTGGTRRVLLDGSGNVAVEGLSNDLTLAGSTTGNPVTLTATGDDTDVDIKLVPRNDGVAITDGNLRVEGADNDLTIAGGTAGNPVTVTATGADADVGITYATKATGSHILKTGSTTRLTVSSAAITAALPLAMGSNLITAVTDPVSAQDAATKAYADTKAPTGSTLGPFLGGYLSGCTLIYNSATQVDFGAGFCTNSTNAYLFASTAKTKILQNSGGWAAGSGQNGLFTGARANNTWYHCFAMYKTTDATVDFGFDTSVSGSNAPANYVVRRIGSVRSDGSGNILKWFQNGDYFYWDNAFQDLTSATATVGSWQTLTMRVPTGVKVLVYGSVVAGNGAATKSTSGFFLRAVGQTESNSDNQAIITRTQQGSDFVATAAWGPYETNTSGQIDWFAAASGGGSDCALKISTRGWTDQRGKS